MTLRHSCFIALSSLLVATQSAVAHAQSADASAVSAEPPHVLQARQHFTQGLKLYKDGDFDAALVQFERAYSTKPNYKVLYNIAQSYFELRQYVEARDALARYLADGGDAVQPERREAVAKDLADLDRRIAHVKLQVNVSGAAVYVDGRRVGTTPLTSRIDVSEGQRTVSVEAPDRGSKQRVIRLAGGEEQAITIDFARETSGPVSRATPGGNVRPATPPKGLGAGFWTTAIGAVALGGGAAVTGYFALKAEDDHAAELKRFGIKQSQLDDSESRAIAFALTTDILAGAAVVCAGVAVVIWATRPSRSEPSGVALTVGPASAQLAGSF